MSRQMVLGSLALLILGIGLAACERAREPVEEPEEGSLSLQVAATSELLTYGETVTFSWAMENAHTLQVERDGKTVHLSTQAVGIFSDEPTLTSTYRFTAARGDETTTHTASVQVRPKFLSLSATDGPIPVGQEVEVSWHVGGRASWSCPTAPAST